MSLTYCKEDENVAGRELKCRGEWILSRNYDIVFIWFIFSIFLKLSPVSVDLNIDNIFAAGNFLYWSYWGKQIA